MTIAPIKDQLDNILSLPYNLSDHLIKFLINTPQQKNSDNDNLFNLGLKLHRLTPQIEPSRIYRGLERGINFVLSNHKRPNYIKINGCLEPAAQNALSQILETEPLPSILQNIKKGLIADCILNYANSNNLNSEKQQHQVTAIINAFSANDNL